LANSLALSGGITFSTFLAVAYLPVALAQNRSLLSYIRRTKESDKDFEIGEWMLLEGIDGFPLKIFSSYMAVFIPLITGLLANLLDKF
jgi:hypothetical protein